MYRLFSFKRKSCLTFFVLQTILKSSFSLVKTLNFFNSCLDTLSFSLQNGIPIKKLGFEYQYSISLNKYLSIIGSYFLLSKPFITLLTNAIGCLALEYLLLIWFISWWKFKLTLHEWYKSPSIALLLYLFGICDFQCTGDLLVFR